jgi:hypothetical protein
MGCPFSDRDHGLPRRGCWALKYILLQIGIFSQMALERGINKPIAFLKIRLILYVKPIATGARVCIAIVGNIPKSWLIR